jgi:hypothetical protein
VNRSDTNEKWQIEQTLETQRDLRNASMGMLQFLDQDGKDIVSLDQEGILRIWTLS